MFLIPTWTPTEGHSYTTLSLYNYMTKFEFDYYSDNQGS